MKEVQLSKEELKRLHELTRCNILDTPAEDKFDYITQLASKLFDAPIVLISLVDKTRQWFKSKVGIDVEETPIEYAFCNYTIKNNEVMIVQDARVDERFKSNPLVLGDPNIVFYAGAPLRTSNNINIGTLCIIDTKPNNLSLEQREILQNLANQVVSQIELNAKITYSEKLANLLKKVNELNCLESDDFNYLIQQYLKTGLEIFGMDIAILSQIKNDFYTIENVIDPNYQMSKGDIFDLKDTYCERVFKSKQTFYFEAASKDFEMSIHPCYKNTKLEAYIGTPIKINNEVVGTLSFTSLGERLSLFNSDEVNFIEILARSLSHKLELIQEKQNYINIQTVTDAAPEYIAMVDLKNNKILYANETLRSALSFSNKKNLSDLLPSWVKEKNTKEGIPYAIQNGVWKGLSAIFNKKGQEIPAFQTIVVKKTASGIDHHYSTIIQDISELNKLKNEFNLNSERLNLALSSAEIGLWDWDLKTNKIFWNHIMYDLYEIGELEDQVEIYQYWISHIHPDDREEFKKHLKDATIGKENFSLEYKVIKENGKIAYFQSSGKTYFDTDGKPSRIIGITWDITSQKEQELKIESSLKQFMALAKLAPIGIYVTDINGHATFFNQRWREIAGIGPNELNPDVIRSAIHPDDIDSLYEIWKNAREKEEKFTHTFRIVNKLTKKVYTIFSQAVPLKDDEGNITGYIGINHDLTEQKQYEKKLAGIIRQLKFFIENTPAAVAMFDRDIKYLSASQKWLDDYELKDRDIIGKSHYEVFPTLPEEWKTHHQNALKGQIIKNDEESFTDANGKTVWLSWDVRPWYDVNGDIGGIMMLTDVITDKIENARKLVAAKEEALRASEAKSIFLSNMSHEIRTPLNSIIGLSDLLTETNLGEDQKNYVTKLQKSGEALLSIINDTLDLSKIEAEKLEIEKSSFFFQNIIDKISGIFSYQSKEKQLSFRMHLDPSLNQEFIGDQARITQVLINLIGNAFKFTLKGSIYLDITPNTNPKRKGDILVTVKDTGIGISSNKTDIIFESFKQADTSTTKTFGGTGLGLTITKKLVEKMGGEIWVDSVPNAGSTFSFTLDVERGNQESSFSKISIDIFEGKKKNDEIIKEIASENLNILIVDDSRDNRSLMQAYLKSLPFHLSFATNGEEALTMLKKNHYDIVFMDMQMPIKDGYTATQEFRTWEQLNNDKRVHIVALSAYALQKEKIKSLNAGCDNYITKPIKKINILEIIRDYINNKDDSKQKAIS